MTATSGNWDSPRAGNGHYPWHYVPEYVSDHEAIYESLCEGIEWEHPRVQVYGRWHNTPRLVSFQGDAKVSYRYSGTRHEAMPWHPWLLKLRSRVSESCQSDFNSVLINYYRSGEDSMGWHSDDERELGPQPVIASVSLGATRRLDYRSRDSAMRDRLSLDLEGGSLLIMTAGCQQNWQHALPKQRRCKKGRINLTFRQIYR